MPKKDEQVVQPDAVPEGTPSPEGEGTLPEGEEKPQEQPFTEAQEAKLQQMLADASAQAETKGYTKGSREMQGKKDGEVARAQRDARYYQNLAMGYDTGFGQENPEQAELIRAKAELAARQKADYEAAQAQQREAYTKSLNESLYAHLEALGIDPTDTRVDFAQDEPDYIKGRGKFDASVARILQENAKVADGKRSQEVKDVEARLRKDLGIDSVDTSASEGATISKKFAQVEQDYADGKISTAEYEKAMEKRK